MFLLVTAETVNHLNPFETNRNQKEAIRNRPKPPRNHPKPSETTRNYLQPTPRPVKLAITSTSLPQSPPPYSPTSHQFLPCFSAFDFEHGFLIRKVKLGKDNKNLAMIMTKSTLLLNSYASSV